MTSLAPRRRARGAWAALGHPFSVGMGLGVVLFAGLWIGGALHQGETSVPPAGAPPVQPTARVVPPPATFGLMQPDEPRPRPILSPDIEDVALLRLRRLQFPVPAADPRRLRDDFGDLRADRSHEALDILAARGAPVVAVDEGVIQKLFMSVRGGLTVYQFDPEGTYCYYYAHLDRYAEGVHEGKPVKKGEVIGFVGTTGNAPPDTPHLHFAIFKLGPEKQWWKGAALNPYPVWREPASRAGLGQGEPGGG